MKKSKQLFKTISGVQKSHNKIKVLLKIHKIEKEIEAHVIKNDNFSYDILLRLDIIKKFRLLQDEHLNIFQRTNDEKLEMVTDEIENQEFPVNLKNNSINIIKIQEKLNHLDQDKSERLKI